MDTPHDRGQRGWAGRPNVTDALGGGNTSSRIVPDPAFERDRAGLSPAEPGVRARSVEQDGELAGDGDASALGAFAYHQGPDPTPQSARPLDPPEQAVGRLVEGRAQHGITGLGSAAPHVPLARLDLRLGARPGEGALHPRRAPTGRSSMLLMNVGAQIGPTPGTLISQRPPDRPPATAANWRESRQSEPPRLQALHQWSKHRTKFGRAERTTPQPLRAWPAWSPSPGADQQAKPDHEADRPSPDAHQRAVRIFSTARSRWVPSALILIFAPNQPVRAICARPSAS